MPNKLPPVLAKHYTQKTIFLHQVGNHQEKVLKPILAQDSWKLLETGKCWQMLTNSLFFHLRLPPLTFDKIVLWSGSARIVHLMRML